MLCDITDVPELECETSSHECLEGEIVLLNQLRLDVRVPGLVLVRSAGSKSTNAESLADMDGCSTARSRRRRAAVRVLRDEWRVLCETLRRTHAFKVVRDAVAATDDHLRIHLIGKRYARHKLRVEIVVQRVAGAVLAGNEQAVGAVLRVLDVNVDFLAVDFIERLVIAIAKADVQRQRRRDLPLIFAEVRRTILALTIASCRTGNSLELGSIDDKVRKAVALAGCRIHR